MGVRAPPGSHSQVLKKIGSSFPRESPIPRGEVAEERDSDLDWDMIKTSFANFISYWPGVEMLKGLWSSILIVLTDLTASLCPRAQTLILFFFSFSFFSVLFISSLNDLNQLPGFKHNLYLGSVQFLFSTPWNLRTLYQFLHLPV